MANAVYPIWKQNLLQATASTDLAGTGATGVDCALVDLADYTYSAAHDFLDDIDALSPDPVVGTPGEIGATKTYTNGTFDGADVTFSSVTGDTVEALVLYRDNAGASSTKYLVLYLDTSVTGLPVTPNGGDITVTWNASGIFTLSDWNAKENIHEVGHINNTFGVYGYNYKGSNVPQLGLIAQEVEKACPSAVAQFGKFKAVDYAHAVRFANAA